MKINDESWKIMCESLANHPALEDLDLHDTVREPPLDGSFLTHRTQCLVDLLKVNRFLVKIYFGYPDGNAWVREVQPRLAVNTYRPRIIAVRKAGDALRAPLLGLALHAVNDNKTLLYMYLKGNVDLLDVIFYTTYPASLHVAKHVCVNAEEQECSFHNGSSFAEQ